MIFLLLGCLLMFVATPAAAFDIFPEYHGISASDISKFETPRDIDAESQSAYLAYQPLLDWEMWFTEQGRVVDTTVGSLTNQHFMIFTRAKFEASLAKELSFHFIYFAQRDREIDQVRQFFELRYHASPEIAVASYIDPSHYKRENDIGGALLYTPEHWNVRAFLTAHDFTRNEHNDQADFFASTGSPYSYGVRAIYSGSAIWSRFGVRIDTPTEWLRPQENRVFHYMKDLAFVDLIWRRSEARSSSIRIQWDSTLKAFEPGDRWRLERSKALYLESFGEESDPIACEVGGMLAFRKWTTTADRQVFHQNVMPHGLLKIRALRRENGFDHVRLGVTATDFHSYGDNELRPSAQLRDTIQGRFDARYEWTLANNARLAAALTFDLDEFPTFEGGNIWFRTGL